MHPVAHCRCPGTPARHTRGPRTWFRTGRKSDRCRQAMEVPALHERWKAGKRSEQRGGLIPPLLRGELPFFESTGRGRPQSKSSGRAAFVLLATQPATLTEKKSSAKSYKTITHSPVQQISH